MMRLIVAALSFGFVYLVVQAFGVKLPTHIGGGSHAAPPSKLPSVSIAGALPCVASPGPPNYLPADKLDTCVAAKKHAKSKLALKYHGAELTRQFNCVDNLWWHESKWSAWAVNPTSDALGIDQALNQGDIYKAGEWEKQVDWGLDVYIPGRYKTPCYAWAFWQCTSFCERYPGGPVNKTGRKNDPMTTWY